MKIADDAIVLIGTVPSVAPAEMPELRVSAADAPARSKHPGSVDDEPSEGLSGFGANAVKAVRVVAIYLAAGIAGWFLYGFAEPFYEASAELIARVDAPTTPGSPELVRAIEKVAADLRTLQRRIEAIETARPISATSLPEDVNRRIDAAKAETEASISQLSARIDELQRELDERGARAFSATGKAAMPSSPRFDATTASGTSGVAHEQWRKGGRKRRGDAFDPALHPTAPGAPRPLGANL